MTFSRWHLDSEQLAISAHEALRAEDAARARALFADAARAETDAYDAVPKDKVRTLGILAVSAAALWFKADELHAAELFIRRALANSSLPSFARRELREELQAIRDIPVSSQGRKLRQNKAIIASQS